MDRSFFGPIPCKNQCWIELQFSPKTSWFYLLLLSFFYYSFQVIKIFFGQQVCHCAFLLFIFRNIIFRSSILHVFFGKFFGQFFQPSPVQMYLGTKLQGSSKLFGTVSSTHSPIWCFVYPTNAFSCQMQPLLLWEPPEEAAEQFNLWTHVWLAIAWYGWIWCGGLWANAEHKGVAVLLLLVCGKLSEQFHFFQTQQAFLTLFFLLFK